VAEDYGTNTRYNFDKRLLLCVAINRDTTTLELAKWVERAKKENSWLILLYHRITDTPVAIGAFDQTLAGFKEHMQVISDSGLPVLTISEAIAEIEPQLYPYR
jgi:hypothetical protein